MQVNLGVKLAKYKDGTKLADVMGWNHYGTETIPPRPVLRIAAEKIISSSEFIEEHLTPYLINVISYTKAGRKQDLKKIETKLLTYLGQQSVSEAKKIINAEEELQELQENAPKTIQKKGFDKPLYETGLMIKNLGFEVTK